MCSTHVKHHYYLGTAFSIKSNCMKWIRFQFFFCKMLLQLQPLQSVQWQVSEFQNKHHHVYREKKWRTTKEVRGGKRGKSPIHRFRINQSWMNRYKTGEKEKTCTYKILYSIRRINKQISKQTVMSVCVCVLRLKVINETLLYAHISYLCNASFHHSLAFFAALAPLFRVHWFILCVFFSFGFFGPSLSFYDNIFYSPVFLFPVETCVDLFCIVHINSFHQQILYTKNLIFVMDCSENNSNQFSMKWILQLLHLCMSAKVLIEFDYASYYGWFWNLNHNWVDSFSPFFGKIIFMRLTTHIELSFSAMESITHTFCMVALRNDTLNWSNTR